MKKVWFAAIVAAFSCLGCKQNLIDHVTFQPSSNLEVVRVSIVFTQNVKSQLSGIYDLKNYGELFANPWTTTEPFEVGFDLNTAIVNDQNYIKLSPTNLLANGVPIGINATVVQIQDPKPINPQFDLYGYVDVLHGEWLGVAAMFTYLNDQNFPAGLTLTQTFSPDKQGVPRILADVFGPTVNSDGTLARAGGIAMFANVKELVLQQIGASVFYPETEATIR